MICKHCNTLNDDTAVFCRKCGLAFEKKSKGPRLFFSIILVTFLLIGMGCIIAGLVLYNTYREIPGYLMIAVIGILFLIFCLPINKKRKNA